MSPELQFVVKRVHEGKPSVPLQAFKQGLNKLGLPDGHVFESYLPLEEVDEFKRCADLAANGNTYFFTNPQPVNGLTQVICLFNILNVQAICEQLFSELGHSSLFKSQTGPLPSSQPVVGFVDDPA